MPDTIHCDTHGDTVPAFVCNHLLGDSFGLGFYGNGPTEADPSPEAWCGDCELICDAHGGWTDEAKSLASDFSAVCMGCYNRIRIRNTRPETSLDDLADLRWKCGSCDEWHIGPCLDFGCNAPDTWTEEHEKIQKKRRLLPWLSKKDPDTFLDEDYCATDGEHFFVRGVIHLPIIGTKETFRFGVWGSLSEKNFQRVREADDDPKRAEKIEPLFSWLSNWIPEFGEVENIKMNMHIQPPDQRPHFEIEHTNHPLAQAFHHGIEPARVKEIMLARLSKNK